MQSKVFIYPANNTENQYINIQEHAIANAGKQVTYSLKDFFTTEYFLLNWFETLGGNIKLDYVKKLIKLAFMSFFQKKILWVVHNKKPHTKSDYDKSNSLSIKLMKRLLKQSYRLIILCDETKEVLKIYNPDFDSYSKKIFKIPHPNYIGIYPESSETKNDSDKKLKILYIGQVNKYKNIEYLIDSVNKLNNENVRLQIAGKCKDSNYEESLKHLAKTTSISFDLRFIPDEELVNLISKNDIIALPYSYESSLNSGTIFLAFSYKKTVISPLIGTLKEFSDKSFFYSYDYKTEDEHKDMLGRTISKVYADFTSDHEILKSKGNMAYNYVKENNGIEKITELYKKLFAE